MRRDGGPVFAGDISRSPGATEGMSLRDYFAGKVLSVTLSLPTPAMFSAKDMAEHAYKMADEMIEARKK